MNCFGCCNFEGNLLLPDHADHTAEIIFPVPFPLCFPVKLETRIQCEIRHFHILAQLSCQFQIFHDQIQRKTRFQISGQHLLFLGI